MGIFRQFPYTNFHDMNLDEIIKIVKNMLEEWAEYYDTWDDWKGQVTQEWADMRSFINNYFNNLNVQTEINNKITAMVRSGEFSEIVDPYVPPAVAEWLAEHITTPETVVIDDSLTIEGAAADAKATGDAIATATSEINEISEETENEFYFTNTTDRTQSGVSLSFDDDDDSSITLSGLASTGMRFGLMGNPTATTGSFTANLPAGTYFLYRDTSAAVSKAVIRYRTQSQFEDDHTAYSNWLSNTLLTIAEPVEVWFGLTSGFTNAGVTIRYAIYEVAEGVDYYIKHGLTAVDWVARNKLNEIDGYEIKPRIAHLNTLASPTSMPVCGFPADFSADTMLAYGASTNATSGMCGDKQRYIWFTYKLGSDTDTCKIVKYDVLENKIVNEVSERSYGHANDMCYVDDTNEIYIISWVTGDTTNYANGGTLDRISVIDADTLLYKRDFGLATLIGGDVDYPTLSAITYNTYYKRFVGIIRPHDVDGTTTKGIVTWSYDGSFIDHVAFVRSATTSGMDCDNKYIYALFGYKLYYYDWASLATIGVTDNKILNEKDIEIGAIQEAESVAAFENHFIVNANNFLANSDPTVPMTTLYKCTPSKFEFLKLTDVISLQA